MVPPHRSVRPVPLFQLLKIESFGSVFKMLETRAEPDAATLVWIVLIIVSIPLALIAIHTLRKKARRQAALQSSYDDLEKIGGEKDLNYLEQVTAERMVAAANLQKPAALLSSIDVFDQAASAWMKKVQEGPWLQMDEQVERLTSLREKLGFRYLPQDRQPQTTRELALDQKLYMLARSQKGFRLLSASVVDLDDLAITTEIFRDSSGFVRFQKQRDMWIFFWSNLGREYRFSSCVLKEVERPVPYLMLRHSDRVIHPKGRKTISCDMDHEFLAYRLPAVKVGRTIPSASLFEKEQEFETLSIHLYELSGSGFVLSADEELQVNDLLKIKDGGELSDVLGAKVGRIMDLTSIGGQARFLNLSTEDRERVLNYVTRRITPDTLKQRTKEKSQMPA